MRFLTDAIELEVEQREAAIAALQGQVDQLQAMKLLADQIPDVGADVVGPPPAATPPSSPRTPRGRPAKTARGERVPSLGERILGVLAHRADANPTELVEAMGDVARPAVQSAVSALVKAGKVKVTVPGRGPHPGRYAIADAAAPKPAVNGVAAAAAPAVSRRVARELEREQDAPPAPAGDLSNRELAREQDAPPAPAGDLSNRELARRLMDRVTVVLKRGNWSVRDIAGEIDRDPADVALAVRKLVSIGHARKLDDGRFTYQTGDQE